MDLARDRSVAWQQLRLFRRDFDLARDPELATLQITADSLYVPNGLT